MVTKLNLVHSKKRLYSENLSYFFLHHFFWIFFPIFHGIVVSILKKQTMIINDSGSFSVYFCSFSIVCCGLIPLLGKIFIKSWSFTFVISLNGSMKWRHVPWTFSVTIFLVQMYFKLTIGPSVYSNTSTLIHLPRQRSAIPMPTWPSPTPKLLKGQFTPTWRVRVVALSPRDLQRILTELW